MSTLSWFQGLTWVQALAWALAAFFVLGFFINTFGVSKVGPEYERWGYPDWFHFVSGGLDLVVALLLPAMMTRPFGVLLGCAIMMAAMATVIYHREYPRAIPPSIVFSLLAIVGWTMF
jgi:DoxX-like family